MEPSLETAMSVMEHRKKIVHMQNIEHPTRTYCGRRFYVQKHVTDRLKNCTCVKCWEAILARYPGIQPGEDSVITILV